MDGTGVAPAKLAEQLLPVLADPAPRSVTAELGPVPADFTTQAENTFRCAVMSDGCFFITKDGTTIELEPASRRPSDVVIDTSS